MLFFSLGHVFDHDLVSSAVSCDHYRYLGTVLSYRMQHKVERNNNCVSLIFALCPNTAIDCLVSFPWSFRGSVVSSMPGPFLSFFPMH